MNIFILQTVNIILYWLGGIALGAFLKTYQKNNENRLFLKLLSNKKILPMLIISSILGAASPITLFGIIPLIYSVDLKRNKKLESILLAFITSSILISPNIFVFTFSLGADIAIIRMISAITTGVMMGLISDIMLSSNESFLFLRKDKKQKISEHSKNKDNKFKVFLKNYYNAFKKTGINLLIGVAISFLVFAFVPQSFYDFAFKSNAVAVPVSAVLSTFFYQCGGGSMPILQQLLREGLSTGAAITFMLVGPLTKITNLAALKSIMTTKKLLIYCSILLVYMLSLGWFLG